MGETDVQRIVDRARTMLGTGPGGRDIDATARTLASTRTAATSTPPPRPPLPRLEVHDRGDAELAVSAVLGEGGMGIVHLARQRSLDRDVALKRIKPDVAVDATLVGALLDEAVTTGSLEHPGIVPVHALGRDDRGLPVLVMKKVEGVTLRDLVHDAAHPGWARVRSDRATFALETAMKIADTLSFAHSRGVLHRDVKPDNVMIGEFGEVTLLDWGIAQRIGTAATAIAGTPAYMAPEMLQPGEVVLDARTDVYLLAATLHECLTLAPPHAGPTLGAVLLSIARSEPLPYGPDVPSDLAEILHDAMHVDREKRPADAAAFRARLQSHLDHRAAAALATAAAVRLDELERAAREPKPDPVAVHAAFHAARFGLEEALRGWPENERARSDLRRTLLVMARFEIAQKNRGAAAALLAALVDAPADLHADLARLDAEAAADAAERARLERIDHDLDQSVSSGARVRVAMLVGVVLALASLVFVAIRVTHVYEPSAGSALVAMVPLTLLGAGLAFLGRRAFFRNRVNRHMTLTILTIVFAILVERIGAFARNHAVEEIVAADALIIATGAGMASLSIRRLYTIPAIAFGVASLLCALIPQSGVFPALGAGAITVASFYVLRHRLRAPWLDAFDEPGAGSLRPERGRAPGVGRA